MNLNNSKLFKTECYHEGFDEDYTSKHGSKSTFPFLSSTSESLGRNVNYWDYIHKPFNQDRLFTYDNEKKKPEQIFDFRNTLSNFANSVNYRSLLDNDAFIRKPWVIFYFFIFLRLNWFTVFSFRKIF